MWKIAKWRLCEGAILAREPRMLLMVDDRAQLRTHKFLDAHPLLLVVHRLSWYGGKFCAVELHWGHLSVRFLDGKPIDLLLCFYLDLVLLHRNTNMNFTGRLLPIDRILLQLPHVHHQVQGETDDLEGDKKALQNRDRLAEFQDGISAFVVFEELSLDFDGCIRAVVVRL